MTSQHHTESQVAEFRHKFAGRQRVVYVVFALLIAARFTQAAGRIVKCRRFPCEVGSLLGLSDRGWLFVTAALLALLIASIGWAMRCPACGGLVWRFSGKHQSCGVDLRTGRARSGAR